MNSSKLKWFLIFIFLAANVYFLFQYNAYSTALEVYTDSEIESASKILSQNGIPIDADTIPRKKTTEDVLKLIFDDSKQEDVARHIMNEKFASYVLPEGIAYTNNSESLIFYSDSTIEYTVGAEFSISRKTDIQYLDLNDSNQKFSSKKLTSKIFTQNFTDSYKMSFKILDAYTSDGKTYVTAIQQINGISIDQGEVTAVFTEDNVTYIKGKIYFSQNISQYSADSLDVINVLFNIESGKSKIAKIEEIYFPVTTDNGSVYLTPSYKLSYSNGEKHLWDATSCVQRY